MGVMLQALPGTRCRVRGRLIAGLGLLVVLLAAAPAQAKTDPLERYARGTWASMVAMTDEHTGLPADFVDKDGVRSTPTSPTNIGAYLWSAVAAERLGIIGHREAVSRLTRTIGTLETMERGNAGQYFNWYDIRDGSVSPTSPGGDTTTPILSSVDNGWLATGLRVVASRVPELRARVQALLDSMDFGFYYRPEVNRILFHYVPSTGEAVCCYDTTVSESRIATYVGIEQGRIPERQYYGTNRAFPDSCDWSWTETKPLGPTRQYLGETVFEGALPYAGMRVTPSWGGSMFEALMPTLFVPEERWAPGSWGVNHPLWVRAQMHHGLAEARYGYWGFSPSNTPEGGYGVYGVDAIGSNPDGYPSNEDATLVDHGFPGCPGRDPQPDPPPSAYTNGVVTPHASFLALRYAPRDALANLRRLERDFPGLYGKWGFRDSVNVDTGHVSDYYLSLDQGMAMAALGNALGGDVLRRAFATQRTERALRPVIGVEEFGATPRGCTITGTPGPDRLRGTRKADVICGLGGDDRIDGGGGGDAIFGDAGSDRLKGGDGADSLYGDDGDDELSGGRGDDVVSGGPGADRLSGETVEQGG
jgi:hypothetical protein